MRKLLALILSLMMIVMVGCSKDEAKVEEAEPKLFTESVEKGKLAIAEEDYSLASSMFKLALEEKEDEEISKLKEQCDLMIEIEDVISNYEDIEERFEQYTEDDFDAIGEELKAMDKDFTKLTQLCDKIIEIDSESQLIIDIAKESKVEIEEALKECKSLVAEFEEIKAEEEKEASNYSDDDFTGDDAIEYAMTYYEEDGSGDTVFQYDTEPEYNEYGKCYRVVLKSKEMMDEGGSGTLFWVLVTEDGEVIEL